MAKYRVGDHLPRELYIRGRGVYDLSKLREKEVKGPSDAELGSDIPQDTLEVNGFKNEKPSSSSSKSKRDKPSKDAGGSKKSSEVNTPAKEKNSPITLTIMHTNDLHGNLLPRKDILGEKGEEIKSKIGGGAEISSVIQKEREAAQEKGENFLLLDAGDGAMGTTISGFFEGKPVIEVMNAQNYDAAALGNHDFDWGTAALQKIMKQADFPFLASNITDAKGKPLPNVQPYIIKELDGVKVGIIGVTTPDTKELNVRDDVKKLNFYDPAESLIETIPLAKKDGAELIIVLSHSGLKHDKEIAKKVKGIDLIIGGHSHDALEEPVVTARTPIVQAGFGGKYVGKVQMQWDPKKNKVLGVKGGLIPINSDEINPDKSVKGIIDKYQKQLDSIMNVKVGETKEDLIFPDDGKETNLGNLFADLIREKGNSDISFINSGALRTNILKGKITMQNVYEVMPFDNEIVTFTMKGKDVLATLEDSAGRDEKTSLQVSGVNILYDSTKPAGSRLVEVKTDDGKPLDPNAEYTVATIDFLTKGGLNYPQLTKGKKKKVIKGAMYEKLAQQIKAKGVIRSQAMGRLQDVRKFKLKKES